MPATSQRSVETLPAESSKFPHRQASTPIKTTSSNDTRLKALLLAYHVIVACVSNTYFQPDEYWQATEAAHRIVFGYGYLTWEWTHAGPSVYPHIRSWSDLLKTGSLTHVWNYLSSGPIRSVLHPYIFVPPYAILRYMHLDGNFLLMTVAPRLVQALFSTIGAWYTYRLANLLSKGSGRCALVSMLLSPYYVYTATRTFSNTTEAALSSVALFYWFSRVQMPSTTVQRDTLKPLIFAATACLLRPTNAVLWIFLIPRAAMRSRIGALQLAVMCSIIALGAVALTAALDTRFHAGLPTLSLVPFILQNIYHSVSLFYGSHPWHWYLSQGLPVILMASLPLSLLGAVKLSTTSSLGRDLVLTVAWTIGIYSLLGHKEWRFLQPILPLLHIFAGAAWQHRSRGSKWTRIVRTISKRVLYAIALPFSAYLVMFHCIGQGYTLPRYIHSASDLRSVGFLMPCHSTPWQSHFHRSDLDTGRVWFVTCLPPSPGQDTETYRDESDYFYLDPVDYLEKLFPSQVDPSFPPDSASAGWTPSHARHLKQQGNEPGFLHYWPSHLVMFDALLNDAGYGKTVGTLLQERGYRVEKTIWNSLFHDDSRRWGDMVVWKHVAA